MRLTDALRFADAGMRDRQMTPEQILLVGIAEHLAGRHDDPPADAASQPTRADLQQALRDLMAAEGGEPDDENPESVEVWKRCQTLADWRLS